MESYGQNIERRDSSGGFESCSGSGAGRLMPRARFEHDIFNEHSVTAIAVAIVI
ncbi:hypothetical protein JXL19_09525 [bacterium]|nr:hypothetical protein [bacterium]